MKITKKANAKINLTLDLTSILPNGYHGLFTVMQSITLGDEVTVETSDDADITLTCSDKDIPCNEKNTAYKAAEIFLREAGIDKGVKINIEKKVPSQAGLGGGSADAAAVLKALNELYPDRVSEKKLYDTALKVGADVPFCLAGGTRLCQNVGEVMTELPAFDSYVVIAKPEAGISTKAAYEKFDNADKLDHPDNDAFLFYASKGDYKKALKYAANLFEVLVPLEEGKQIKRIMNENGAYYSAMSGSGSAYFGLFDDESKARSASEELKKIIPFAEVFHTTE